MGEERNLKKQLARRRRINRIKMGIISSIFIWMLISVILIVFLMVRINSLEKELSVLASNQMQISQMNEDNQNATSGAAESVQTEINTENSNSEESNIVLLPSSDESNLAEPGDVPKVYLTFDDGPSSNTDEILDILDHYGVKATFFVIGKEDEDSIARYQRIVSEGHSIGIHSYAHRYSSVYASKEAFVEDLTHLQSLIESAT
nr:polysaccharide deacetylase family protein [Treponema sp.]